MSAISSYISLQNLVSQKLGAMNFCISNCWFSGIHESTPVGYLTCLVLIGWGILFLHLCFTISAQVLCTGLTNLFHKGNFQAFFKAIGAPLTSHLTFAEDMGGVTLWRFLFLLSVCKENVPFFSWHGTSLWGFSVLLIEGKAAKFLSFFRLFCNLHSKFVAR